MELLRGCCGVDLGCRTWSCLSDSRDGAGESYQQVLEVGEDSASMARRGQVLCAFTFEVASAKDNIVIPDVAYVISAVRLGMALAPHPSFVRCL